MRMGHVGDAASPNMLDSLNHAEANPPLPSRNDGGLSCAVVMDSEHATTANPPTDKQQSPLAYLTTREFYITLLLGQILAITNTACSTFSTLLADRGVSLPATQTFFNYLLLTVIFTSYTIHRHGLQGWTQSFLSRGWKYLLLSLFDVEGNYFLVLAYRNTTLLSAQLINFWAIAIVVLISSTVLGVHYHRPQLLGISICITGMLLLLFSDRTPPASAHNKLLGDLSALSGATSYGLANVLEEVLVTTAPIAEVLGQMALCGACITALQAVALGELSALRSSSTVWDARVLGWWAAYTLCLAAFYCLVPLLLRRASAAFFNLSMLTMNCWGVAVGVLLFRYQVGWAYPVAFALIVAGQGVYFLGAAPVSGGGAGGGEKKKPWVRSYSGSGRVDTGRRGQRLGGLEALEEEEPCAAEHSTEGGRQVGGRANIQAVKMDS
ncbi:DUF914 domain membrane protein [Aspergillus aculeatinus CBS 121060]|uniref:DUF914-domain-containing protein n=1 Tax=Aspergillus aculeatinus CBS 121060 TaxID=1448322 RepID=A0ACD1HNV7_9EURO|nr:DUF914-domain-containing protein [Aspergillus aculeatinus CBS 121060]RAH75367.1 DUF914-domain-containing protein [Aspergillus aculeatinus CBS 121060]